VPVEVKSQAVGDRAAVVGEKRTPSNFTYFDYLVQKNIFDKSSFQNEQ
jgi:hypothetical protein